MADTERGQELVGRGYLVRDLAAGIADPHYAGAILVGDPGVGKTALARTVVAHLDGKLALLPITASSSLRQVPFGALSPYLTSLSINDVGSSVAVYRSIMAHLDAKAAGDASKLLLFLVDDAHELDDSTSVLLSQLVASRRAKVLVLARATPGPPPEFLSLLHDGLVHLYDLGPLNVREVHQLCVRELGGEVLDSLGAAMANLSGGNPMFLLALLQQGKRDGYLVERNGVWRLVGQPPPLDRRLVDLISSRFRRRSKAELAALEILALAEPLPLAVVFQCAEREAVENLHDDGLITITMGRDQVVSLGHPLYGEVLRSQIPAGRSMSTRRQLLGLMGSDTQSAAGFLRYVSWGLDCGAPPEDATLLKAAVIANRLYDSGFALRAARAVHAPNLRGQAMVEIARAQMMRGDYAYARTIVEEVIATCSTLWLAKEVIFLSGDLRLRQNDGADEIRRDAQRWRAIIRRVAAEKSDATAREKEVARSLLGCGIIECFALNYEGRFSEAEAELRAIMADPDGSEDTYLGALALLGEALGSTGRPLQGAAATGEALGIILKSGHRYLAQRQFVITRHCLCLTLAGEWEQISSLLQGYSASANGSLTHFGGALEFAEGLIALRKGLMRTARSRLVLAVEGFREGDIAQMMTMALGLAAFASAMTGDITRARAYISDWDAHSPVGGKQSRLLGEIHVIAANALFQGAARSIGQLRKIADTAESEGMSNLAYTALELCVRLGDTHTFPQLARITADFEGAEAEVLHAMASAAAARDPDALLRAADRAADAEYLLICAECLGLAVKTLTQQGVGQKARQVQTRVNQMLDQLEGIQRPQFTETATPAPSKLTPREQEIVTLASRGFSNAEIAAEHGVSVRTVEGHLYRIFAKLGISRREELPRI